MFGHHCLNVTDVEAHKKFFVETLGGVEIVVDVWPETIIRFPKRCGRDSQGAESGRW